MFELSLTLAVLMILTALIPFSVRSNVLCVLLCLPWIFVWGVVHLANSHLRFVPAVVWLYVFLIIAFPCLRWTKRNWIWFPSMGLCCALVAYGIALVEFVPAYREHQELLVKHPALDLKPRLAYELTDTKMQSGTSATGPVVADSAGVSNYNVDTLIEMNEAFRQYLDLNTFQIERRRTDRRSAFQALTRVHEGFVADFIAQPGLGRSRIPGLKLLRKSNFIDEWDGVRLDVPPELIEQPDPLQLSAGSAYPSLSTDEPAGAGTRALIPPIPDHRSLQYLHIHNITNFVPLNSLGGVNAQLQARGFDAHAFHLAPTKSVWEASPKGWRLSRLELVSLLKHDPPAVYVSRHLPAMDELRDAPIRSVTPFESDAITKLVNGLDLVVEQTGDQELSMVGSIRAIADCRDCHRVPLGGLLGAFTYKLKPRP
ncbi:MAG: hypothetical protein JSS49_02805 [Planctomycetes bacterium]|nr:hypothetical protein [Planctomycetota bacterium]